MMKKKFLILISLFLGSSTLSLRPASQNSALIIDALKIEAKLTPTDKDILQAIHPENLANENALSFLVDPTPDPITLSQAKLKDILTKKLPQKGWFDLNTQSPRITASTVRLNEAAWKALGSTSNTDITFDHQAIINIAYYLLAADSYEDYLNKKPVDIENVLFNLLTKLSATVPYTKIAPLFAKNTHSLFDHLEHLLTQKKNDIRKDGSKIAELIKTWEAKENNVNTRSEDKKPVATPTEQDKQTLEAFNKAATSNNTPIGFNTSVSLTEKQLELALNNPYYYPNRPSTNLDESIKILYKHIPTFFALAPLHNQKTATFNAEALQNIQAYLATLQIYAEYKEGALQINLEEALYKLLIYLSKTLPASRIDALLNDDTSFFKQAIKTISDKNANNPEALKRIDGLFVAWRNAKGQLGALPAPTTPRTPPAKKPVTQAVTPFDASKLASLARSTRVLKNAVVQK